MTKPMDEPAPGEHIKALHDAFEAGKLVRFRTPGGATGKIVEMRGGLGGHRCRVRLIDIKRTVDAWPEDIEVIGD